MNLLNSTLLEVDYFGSPISFTKGGSDTVKTYFGAIISFCILATTIYFGTIKFQLMAEHGDTIH